MKIVLRLGDCLEALKEFEDGSIASVVCDPPYAMNFSNESADMMLGQIAVGEEKKGIFWYGGTHNRGYIDNDNTELRLWNEEWLGEVYRILRTGGTVKAFSGTRTLHALGAAMDNTGFQDITLGAWVYGSGMPKSKHLLKPSWEPILVGVKE